MAAERGRHAGGAPSAAGGGKSEPGWPAAGFASAATMLAAAVLALAGPGWFLLFLAGQTIAACIGIREYRTQG